MESQIMFDEIANSLLEAPDITKGKMFGSETLKINNKVFAMLVKGDLVTKLSKPRVSELLAQKTGEIFDPGHGNKMTEWIRFSENQVHWKEWIQEARDYVLSLTK